MTQTNLLNCCERSGFDAERELLSFSSVLWFLFCSGDRTGDGRLPIPTYVEGYLFELNDILI